MIRFDDRYFSDCAFTAAQVKKNLENALKDFNIARQDKIPDVKFTYSYDALIKGGITLASMHNKKIKSVPGHHVKIIEMMANILNDETIGIIGNAMRSKRNTDFYSGGVEVTEKEAQEYLKYVDAVVDKIKKFVEP